MQTQRQQPATPQVQQPVQAQAQQPAAAQAQQLKPTFDVFATACGPDALKRPTAIVVDRQGNVFVSDTDNNRIVKLTPSGVCLDQWAVEKPTRFALDTQGTVVYLADMANNRIRKLNLQTRKLDVFVGNGHQFGQVDRPAGILVNNDNTIVVADSGNDRVQELSAQGKSLRQWTVKGASDVALETDGEVYASGTGANTNQTTVWKLTRDSKASMIFASDRALEITSDTGGTVFGSTTTDLRKLQDDGQAQTVKLLLPTGLAQPPSFAFDQRGTLYLVNAATGQILTMR